VLGSAAQLPPRNPNIHICIYIDGYLYMYLYIINIYTYFYTYICTYIYTYIRLPPRHLDVPGLRCVLQKKEKKRKSCIF